MKRIITLALSLILISSFAAGCGKDKRMLYNVDLKDYVKVGEYKGISVDTSSDEYKEMYDDIIYSDVETGNFYEEVSLTEGTVQLGDTVNINYSGKKDGVAFEGGTADNQELVIGSGSFIDGFEDGLIGVAIGDTVDLDLSFPDPYPNNPDLAGAPVVFTVKVNSVTKRAMEIDSIYKELGHKTVKAYEIDLKKRATVRLIISKLSENAKVTKYSDKDIDFLYDEQISGLEKQLSAYGYDMTAEDYIKNYYKMSMDEYKKKVKESLQSVSKQHMILYYIFDSEKMTCTEDEINAKVNEIVEANEGTTAQEVKDAYGEYYFEIRVVTEKVSDFLYENAKIK